MVAALLAGAGCLEAPPPGDDRSPAEPGADDPASGSTPDGSVAVESCALVVTYASTFSVGAENGRVVDLDGFAVIGNLGDEPVSLDGLTASVATAPGAGLLVASVSGTPGTLPPGEAHGQLDETVRPMVASEITETWTDDDIPSLRLHFDGSDDFDVAEGTVTLSVGGLELVLPVRFESKDWGTDVEDVARVTASCSGA
ncbi:MAG TPA: hypothetical protein VMZ28_04660 [Kofleriaceae bacterium]|nr:hypothetical protein [Kofleriaceae bacterium]